MSQLTDFIHHIEQDFQGGINFGTASKIVADIKAQVPIIEADAQALATYINSNAAVEEGILSTLIQIAPQLGIPAAGVLALQAALGIVTVMVNSGLAGNSAVAELEAGFTQLTQVWGTRLTTVLNALGIK